LSEFGEGDSTTVPRFRIIRPDGKGLVAGGESFGIVTVFEKIRPFLVKLLCLIYHELRYTLRIITVVMNLSLVRTLGYRRNTAKN
jgi:hypothetical protein